MPSSFYYDHAEEAGLVKKALSPAVRSYVERSILPAFIPISHEDYWRKHAKWMMTAVRASYFMHDGAAHWALELEPFTVIRFLDGQIHEAELQPIASDADDDPQYDLIFDAWDDIMEGETEHWDPCTDADRAAIATAMDWTEAMHATMNERIPFESLLEDDAPD